MPAAKSKKRNKYSFTKAGLRQALRDLGNTPDRIYKSLKRRKIKGDPSEPETCPIAIYLDRCFPKYFSEVGQNTINIFDESANISIDLSPTPTPVRKFIIKFDSEDHYEDLRD